MRTVKMQGGLGNQLFCLGFAQRVAEVTGQAVALDVASYQADRYGHDFDLAALASRLNMALTRRPLMSSRVLTAAMGRMGGRRYVSERAEALVVEAMERGRYFNGYWQDEHHLSAGFRRTARDYLLERAADGPTHGVVIHCRTYKEEVRPERRAVPDRHWFLRCLEILTDQGVDLADIVLISDDADLALAHVGDIGHPVRAVVGGTQWTDMALMLRAETLVLTNSSFSWWGGWCGEAETILYPAKGSLFHYAAPARRFTVVE